LQMNWLRALAAAAAAECCCQLLAAASPHEAAAACAVEFCLQGPAASLALQLSWPRGVECLTAAAAAAAIAAGAAAGGSVRSRLLQVARGRTVQD
jgi:hypothetical protein